MSTNVIDTLAGRVEIKTPERVLSQQDNEKIWEAAQRMSENGWDIWVQDGINQNSQVLFDHFNKNRHIAVSVESVFDAVRQNPTAYKWLSAAEAAWYRLATQNPDRANRLVQITLSLGWGKPERLSNSGDAFFTNLTWLLAELEGREITPETIQQAEGRVNAKRGTAGNGLIYVQRPRPEHYSQAAKDDDGKSFLGTEDMVKIRNHKGEVIGLRSKTAQEQAAANPAAAPPPDLTKEEASWRQIALDYCKYGFHSDQQQIKKLFDASRAAGHTWRQTAEIVSKKVAELKKNRSLMR